MVTTIVGSPAVGYNADDRSRAVPVELAAMVAARYRSAAFHTDRTSSTRPTVD
jgi:hypothetical protein